MNKSFAEDEVQKSDFGNNNKKVEMEQDAPQLGFTLIELSRHPAALR